MYFHAESVYLNSFFLVKEKCKHQASDETWVIGYLYMASSCEGCNVDARALLRGTNKNSRIFYSTGVPSVESYSFSFTEFGSAAADVFSFRLLLES